jgi:hypothetical protein
MLLYGNGTISGASSMPNNIQFGGTVGVTGALNTSSTFTTSGALTASAGIAFPATQNASSDANILDDYEEGSWTPGYNSASSIPSATGTYVKLGRMVTILWQIQIVHSGTTLGQITGIPFAFASPGQNYVSVITREWYSTGNAIVHGGSVGGTTFDMFWTNNTRTVVNGTTYGFSGSVSYFVN